MPAYIMTMTQAQAKRFKELVMSHEAKDCQVSLLDGNHGLRRPILKSNARIGFYFHHDDSDLVVFRMHWNQDGSEVSFGILKMSGTIPTMDCGSITLHISSCPKFENTHVRVGDWLVLSWMKEKFQRYDLELGKKYYEKNLEIKRIQEERDRDSYHKAYDWWVKCIEARFRIDPTNSLKIKTDNSCSFDMVLLNGSVITIDGVKDENERFNFSSGGKNLDMVIYMALNNLEL